MRATTAAIALLLGAAYAQSLPGPPCQLSVGKEISFSSPLASERLSISIGAGACHSATLTLLVTDQRANVLYRYSVPFKQLTATPWDDPDLPAEAQQLVDAMVRNAVVSPKDVPRPDPNGETLEGGSADLLVPKSVFERLISNGQTVLYHWTYYEGGQYVVFDPAEHIAKVVLRYGP